MLLLWAVLVSPAPDFLFSYFLQDENVGEKLCVNFPVIAVISTTQKATVTEWRLGDGCSFNQTDPKTLNVTFSCSNSGMNTLGLTMELEGETQPVTKDWMLYFEDCNEFHWYARVRGAQGTQRMLTNSTDLEMWVVSSAIGVLSESDHTASEPSPASRELAKALHVADVKPVVTLMGSDGEVLERASVGEAYYNQEKTLWTATVFFQDWTDMYARIESSETDVAGNNIDVTRETLCPQFVSFATVFQALYLIKVTRNIDITMPTTFKGTRHPCVQSTACVLSGSYLLTTNDDFDTIEVWDIAELRVRAVAMTMQSLIFLCEDKLLKLPLNGSAGTEVPITGDRILVPNSCLTLEDAEAETSSLDWMAVYNTTGEVLLSPDQGITFEPLDIGNDVEEIIDGDFLVTGKGTLHLCVKLTGGKYCVRTFDPETKQKVSDFVFDGTKPSLKASSVGHLYLLDAVTRISTDTGATFAQLSRGQGTTATSDNSIVTDMAFSDTGDIVVRRDNGLLEYGRIDLNLVVNLQAQASSRSVARFDSLGRLALLEFPEMLPNGKRSLEKYSIPLTSEKKVAIEQLKDTLNIECPMNQFDVKLPPGRSAYLDLNTELVIETTTVSRTGVYPLTQTSDELEMEIFRSSANDVALDPETNVFYSSKRISQNISLEGVKKGASHMIITVSGSTIACEDSVKILRLLVGCPKNRNIRIKGSNYIRLFYSKTRFRPELELFDGDDYVMDVDADFALYVTKADGEKADNVRYCMKARDVGCQRKPQSWEDFENATDWNKSSYASCFDGSPEEYEEKLPYPILNSTGQNCIIFVPWNQVYKVRAVVLDPEFSYCHLSTEFTVEVWGQPQSIYVTLGIMGGVLVGCIIVLAIVGCYERRKHRKMVKGGKGKGNGKTE